MGGIGRHSKLASVAQALLAGTATLFGALLILWIVVLRPHLLSPPHATAAGSRLSKLLGVSAMPHLPTRAQFNGSVPMAITDSWSVTPRFYGSLALTGSTGLSCAGLKGRAPRAVGTIRPPGQRTIIDATCLPANSAALDAGVCVQIENHQRREIACLPSLAIFGFQKCGTAELQGWLSAHPVLQRWQGNTPQWSGAGEADYFNRQGHSASAIATTWSEQYLKAGFVLTKPSDVANVYTFEKSPK
jgi:hypothetical protein